MGYPDDAGLGIEVEIQPTKLTQPKRLWIFSVEDFDGNEAYLDKDGNETDEETAKGIPFTGTNFEAQEECDRRADLWEDKQDCCAAQVTQHSLGKV